MDFNHSLVGLNKWSLINVRGKLPAARRSHSSSLLTIRKDEIQMFIGNRSDL
jgi:hypothetical protein